MIQPEPAGKPFRSEISARCKDCRHEVCFQSFRERTRFVLSSGWLDSFIGALCPVCLKKDEL